MQDKETREAFNKAWAEAMSHDEGWTDAGWRVWQAAQAPLLARVRELETEARGTQQHYMELVDQVRADLGMALKEFETICLYCIPDLSKPCPPHIANDLIVIERMAKNFAGYLAKYGEEK